MLCVKDGSLRFMHAIELYQMHAHAQHQGRGVRASHGMSASQFVLHFKAADAGMKASLSFSIIHEPATKYQLQY